MATRKVWNEWTITLRGPCPVKVCRVKGGAVGLWDVARRADIILSPSQARRLYQKLSGDYRD